MGLPTGGRLKFKNESMNHCIKCIAILAVWFYTFGAAYARNGQEEKIPTIQEFVDSTTRSSEGVLNVYEKGGHYYLEIPLKLMGRDFVSFVTIIKNAELEQRGSSSMYGYAGDALNPQMFRFLKGEDDVVYLQVADENVVELKENEIYDFMHAVEGVDAVKMFPVKAKGEASVVIDFTDVLMKDNSLFYTSELKGQMEVGAEQADRCVVTSYRSFPVNVNFRVLKTYAMEKKDGKKKAGDKTIALPSYSQWELGISMLLLDEQPMRPRLVDERVGYFTNTFSTYDLTPLGAQQVGVVNRWRLEPRPEDLEKYMAGELVEPAKPIVFYVDYHIPAWLQPYLIEAVNAWEPAFHRAGFKNAIVGKRMPRPEEDPDFSIDDARYSIISYKVSPIQNAYGPSRYDPRSGEIYNSHIAIFHDVQKVIQRWFFVQTAAINPRIREFPWPDSIVGQLVQYVVCHEVGHTLGLRHNFIGSYVNTIEQIRDREHVKRYGQSSSIMDYARFNYVAQPEDSLDLDYLIPQLGEYDKYAIEWGYRYFPQFKDAVEERAYLREWVTKEQANPYHLFGMESNPRDPRLQMEDLGENSMRANELGMENLKRIMAHLEEWTKGDDEENTLLREMYYGVRSQYMMYVIHVLKNLAGYEIKDRFRFNGVGYMTPMSRAHNKEALAFLERHWFTFPEWLFTGHFKSILGTDGVLMMKRFYASKLRAIPETVVNLYNMEYIEREDMYTAREYLEDVYVLVFREAETGDTVSSLRRELQRLYLEMTKSVMETDVVAEPELTALFLQHFKRVGEAAQRALERAEDEMDRAHWSYVLAFTKQLVSLENE